MSNSPLVCFTKISPNKNYQRSMTIDTIAIHCMAGDMTIESCGNWFAKPQVAASSQYGIGSDGRIGQYCDESSRSWCTSTGAVDNRAVTIEVASKNSHPYKITDAAYKSLVNLCVDICERNNIPQLLWKADKSLMGDISKQNMVVHRWIKNKACPGDYLYNLHGQIANEVNAILKGDEVDNMTLDELNKILDTTITKRLKEVTPTRYKLFKDIPEWGKPSIKKCIDAKFISGTGEIINGEQVLDLSEDFIRTLVVLDRSGVFNK